MNISKISLISVLLFFVCCNNVFATDYCPSPAQISAGQFNGWGVYIQSSTGPSDFQPANNTQIQQLESTDHSWVMVNWSEQFPSWGVQNAICIYTGPVASRYLISKTELEPTSPLWDKGQTEDSCGQDNVKLCPFG